MAKSEFSAVPIEAHPYASKGMEYYYPFINKYIKVPKSIKNKINTDYSDKSEGVQQCIGVILANLVNRGVVAYSRRREHYAEHGGKYYTYDYMIPAVDLLYEDGYAFSRNGYKDAQYSEGVASTLHPLEKIYGFPTSETLLDFKNVPLLQIDKRHIYDKRDLKNVTASHHYFNQSSHSQPQSSPHTTLSHNGMLYTQCFSESRTLNRDYFNKMKLDFGNLRKLRFAPLKQVSLTRIFVDNGCGRWFQKGGLSYQQLSHKERPRILLNGFAVVELDYSAMHPHILYAWENQQCPPDFYQRIASALNLKYTDDVKFVVKRVALSAVNAGDEVSLGKSISKDKKDEIKANATRRNEGRDERLILYDELRKLGIDHKIVVEAFRKAHPAIASRIYSNAANELMLDESNIMTLVLLELKDKRVPAIPVHDSVIVPIKHKVVAKQTMLSTYTNHMGFKITVK